MAQGSDENTGEVHINMDKYRRLLHAILNPVLEQFVRKYKGSGKAKEVSSIHDRYTDYRATIFF